MHIPRPPPPFDLQRLFTLHKDSSEKLANIVCVGAAPDGRYRHWDRLKRLKPPEGLTSEEWWSGIKLARYSMLQETPLRDGKGEPFRLAMIDLALEKLHTLDRDACGPITSAAEPITNASTRDYYLVRSLMEEAITSSQLEGASTTRAVAKEMLRTGRPPRDKSERMILNNFRAMKRVRDLVATPLTPQVIIDLHRLTTQDTLAAADSAGRFRRPDERVVVEDELGEVLHVPPPAEQLDRRIIELCSFANGETPAGFMHPIARAVLLHFWLAYDHPFVDGNGRTSRALFYWSLLRSGYWLCEFISISRILKKAPARYARAFLYTETDANDLTYFLLFQLDVLRRAIDDLYGFIKAKTAELRATQALIDASALLNHRQATLLSDALKHPTASYTIQEHQRMHGVVYQTARTDLLSLAAANLLTSTKVGKSLVFRVPPDLAKRMQAYSAR